MKTGKFFIAIGTALLGLSLMACQPEALPEKVETPAEPEEPVTPAVEEQKSIPVSAISLEKDAVDLLAGETVSLVATVIPADATDRTVVWATSNAEVATVENGVVSALSAGLAVITATAGSYSASCSVSVTVPFEYGGMCLETIKSGFVIISNPNGLTIDYKKENRDWVSSSNTQIDIVANEGERIWFRGLNESYAIGNPEEGYKCTVFRGTGEYYLYGNLMSLIYGDEYESKTEITGGYAFTSLFSKNSRIRNHPTLDIELPATKLSPSCYRNMFYGCTQLTRAPKLPAKKLEEACYASMFEECHSLQEAAEMDAEEMAYMSCTWMYMRSALKQAPELPAMKLARACYEFMFMECPYLKKGPSILPATELEAECYTGMFQRCDDLKEAPELPATEMKNLCYSHMFNGCMKLKTAPKLPATTLAHACYQRMFGNSGLVEAPELPAMQLEVACYEYMFENCEDLEKAPVLPAETLTYWCYEKMFKGCSRLNYIKVLATKATREMWSGSKAVEISSKTMGNYCMDWVKGVAASGTFVKHPDATWETIGNNGVPEGWTVE